jgi:ketopantoate reductase
MQRVRPGTIGILPAGALGVALFYQLTRELTSNDGKVFFLERAASSSAEALRAKGELIISGEAKLHHVPTANLLRCDLLTAFEQNDLPEVLLLCPNPDQLPGILIEVVRLLERMNERSELTPEFEFPILVLSSNGIYFQRLRQQFIERLEESTLLGRLPDLWPDLMPRIIGHLLRGVTIQTGVRDGVGAEAVYHPGPRGITRIAGGEQSIRTRAFELLRSRGGWFELTENSSATRLEFDKAMVNLIANLLGQLYAIDVQGNFRLLRVKQIATTEHREEIRTLTRHVFEVGRAVKAYRPSESFDTILQSVLDTTHQHDEHVPSSLQWLALRLRQGQLEPKLTPTEEWLLDPLIRYAHAAELHESGEYFEALKARAIESLTLAVRRQRNSNQR